MQFLKISKSTKLTELADTVGSQNLDRVLNVNQLIREPNIGKQFYDKCEAAIASAYNVEPQRKISLLNKFTQDADIFETVALLDESGWKLLSATGNVPKHLQMPDTCQLPPSINILGSGEDVAPTIYTRTMRSLETAGEVDPAIFGTYSAIQAAQLVAVAGLPNNSMLDSVFKIPWGKISLYSSLSNSMMDIPVYPEELSDSYKANYTEMPELLYQYEPWQLYHSSGARSNTYTFFMHRDMWHSDHTKGGANELIRFCEANCYPEYDGSAVYSATVTLYINGSPIITGVLTQADVDWSGPLGLDGYYLAVKLTLHITEVSARPLSFNVVRQKPLIG